MSLADELQKLETLRASGALSESEYALAKAHVLNGTPAESANPLRSFYRSSHDRWIGGICGGLGASTPIPSWGWRVVFCVATLYFGFGLIPYILLWIFVPSDYDPG